MDNLISDQNNQDVFPLKLECLKKYAKRWKADNPKVETEKIILYGYSSAYASKKHTLVPTKYCVIFYIKEETPPVWNPETIAYDHISSLESFEQSIYDYLECFHTIYDEYSYSKLMDASFTDVYLNKPDKNFRDEWLFLTGGLAEGCRSIMENEPYWVIYNSEQPINTTTIESETED